MVPLGVPDPRTSVRCPSCALAVAAGATFCPHCGGAMAAVGAASAAAGDPLPCPACVREDPGVTMASFALSPQPGRQDGYPVHGCRRCGGAWVPDATLRALVEQARRGEIAGAPPTERSRTVRLDQPVVYRSCPECGEMMLRRNFARISGVITDTCRAHGTFFDAGELGEVLEFVRGGGLAQAARAEAEEDARQARAREAARSPVDDRWIVRSGAGPAIDDYVVAAGAGAAMLGATWAFLSWGARWVRDRVAGDE